MDTDLAGRLDRSIGTAPDGPDALAGVLAEGHRVVRRRRIAGSVASAAAVVVVVGGAALATGGSSDRAAPPVADPPAASPSVATDSASASPSPTPTATWAWGEDLAAYDFARGEVVTRPDATVLRRIDNPYDLVPPAGSSALEMTSGAGVRFWYAFSWDDGGGGSASTRADQADGPFRSWVENVRPISGSEAGPDTSDAPPPAGEPADGLVQFVGVTEELEALDGATVVTQRAGVRVGDDFAGPDDRTAAAQVRTAQGDELFVLVRAFPGEPAQVISVPVDEVGGGLDAFLDYARDAYAGGGGLL